MQLVLNHLPAIYRNPTFTCISFHIQKPLLPFISHLTRPFIQQWRPLTCGQVVGAIAPCLGYLRNGGSPPPTCCNGVRGLRNQARTTGDRKTICNCLKSASSSYRGVSGNYAASLPGKCGSSDEAKFKDAKVRQNVEKKVYRNPTSEISMLTAKLHKGDQKEGHVNQLETLPGDDGDEDRHP
ncbi:non-specific lipid-transfer protein 1-like protein [Tanacetum coccineum]